jgi:hypothetical protein
MRVIPFFCLCLTCLAVVRVRAADAVPSAWQYFQELAIAQPGFVKLALPPETMNAADPDLADLRFFGSDNQETPFVLESPSPVSARLYPVKEISSSVQERSTLLLIETGVAQPIDAILLESPAATFMKAADVDGSKDGQSWNRVASAKLLFRLPNASETSLSIPLERYSFLRVTIHDDRSAPIPFSNIRVRSRPPDRNPPRPLAAETGNIDEAPRETRIALHLGAANLFVSSLEIDAKDPFFSRRVSVLVPKMRENEVVEEEIATAVLSRIRLDDTVASESRWIEIERQILSESVIVVIHNEDAPPLSIGKISAQYRPFTAGFYAQAAGRYLAASGNATASPARYELNLIRDDVARLNISEARLGPLTRNPAYREPETLPGIAETGAPIDLKDWKFRKQMQTAGLGMYQVQLDPETLSLASPGLADLRVVQNEKQLPYLLQRTQAVGEFAPMWTATNTPNRPTGSSWILTLPYESLPLSRLIAQVQSPLFQRTILVYDLGESSRGEDQLRLLGQATWTRKPNETNQFFTIELNAVPRSNRLLLETENGDNPSITIQNVKLAYPITRVLFKATADPLLHLYFGNPEARSPHYDLAIVGEQILRADKRPATLGSLERLKPTGVRFSSRSSSWAFWTVLVAVVAGLLFIVTRLLPPARETGATNH